MDAGRGGVMLTCITTSHTEPCSGHMLYCLPVGLWVCTSRVELTRSDQTTRYTVRKPCVACQHSPWPDN